MAFSIKELAISLTANSEDDGKGWVVVIGCGPRSVMPAGCQSGTDQRYDPFDYAQGIDTKADLKALRTAMDLLLERLSSGRPAD
jgi:hypothetical protein